jgi:NAD(P)-dependent dehydrogenase (short-subunit alcohol dehydrogenase family)
MNPADGEAAPSNLQHKALERYGHVDEIASFVVYLASPEASLITGASLLAVAIRPKSSQGERVSLTCWRISIRLFLPSE